MQHCPSTSKSGIWVLKGCLSYREDKLKKHTKSNAHLQAMSHAAEEAIASVTGGLQRAFQERRMGAGMLLCVQ